MNKSILFALVLLVAASACAGAVPPYSGTLSAGSITAQGGWKDTKPFINWTVSVVDSQTWQYNYVLDVFDSDSGQEKAISHMIIEASPNSKKEDFFNISLTVKDKSYNNYEFDFWTSTGDNSSNPGMPGNTYGIKFEVPQSGERKDSTMWTVSFQSHRQPVWGDFYAKSGSDDNLSVCYNAGFTASDSDPANSINSTNHIVVPDSAVPEPGTMALSGTGLAAMLSGLRLKRARRK